MDNPIKQKKDLHILRKIWHMIPGVSLVVVIYFKPIPVFLITILLGLLFLIIAVAEVLRLNYRQFNKLTIKISRHIIRREELKQISGVPYYVGACFLVLLFFNVHIASLSILYLALGDPLASFFGIKYGEGSYKFKNGKSLIGTLAAITVCMIVTMAYGTLVQWDVSKIYPLALFGGIAGGLAETFVLDDINDNLFIPIVSGIVLSIVYANLFI